MNARIDPANLQRILSGLEGKSEAMDTQSLQLAAVLAFGRRTSAQPPLAVLVQDAGSLVGEMLQTELSGVAQVIPGGALMLTVTGAADPTGAPPRTVTHKGPVNPDASLAGYAMNTACSVVAVNLAEENRFSDLFLRKLSVASALCVPLHLGDKAFGALGAYTTAPRQFTDDDLRFVETIAHLMASSLARLRLEEELRRQQALAAAVLQTVDSPVVTLDADGQVLDMNPACQRLAGRTAAEARGKIFWSLFLAPEEVDPVRRIFRTSLRERSPCEFEAALLTKHGERRQIGWSLRVIGAADGQSVTVLLVGADRTEQMQGLAALLAEDRPDGHAAAGGGTRPFQPVDGRLGKDLRGSPRQRYQYRQKIAPMFGRRIPPKREFFEVECRDISAGGVSFLLDAPPDFENLVVALGRPPVQSHFTARVVRVIPTDNDGRLVYLVGCRFTGRMAP